MWSDRRILDLFGIELPILLAPMAGPVEAEMTIAVSEAGGLGALPCALFSPEKTRTQLGIIRQRTRKPINLNFFCHTAPQVDDAREAKWRQRLAAYYTELGIDPAAPIPTSNRTPFDADLCALVEEFKPEVVSFHFGLPPPDLMARLKAVGTKIIASATTVDEAHWLEDHGCDAVIAQGAEAGGHRGMFLTDDVTSQVGTFALVPQIVDTVKVPVIAAGGIADGRGVAAVLALGASAAQVGTAYMFCPEAKVAAPHAKALRSAKESETSITNVFTGKPARGITNRIMREVGPMSDDAPEFPLAGGAVAPLRAKSEPAGSGDFMSLWAGQAFPLSRKYDGLSAGELTRRLAMEAAAS